MKIDDFAPNLSFFFSYGMEPEYAVLGRVARRIWAVAMRDRYGANERSQSSSSIRRPPGARSTLRRSPSTTSAPRFRH